MRMPSSPDPHAQFSRSPADLFPVFRTAAGGDGHFEAVVVLQVPGDGVGAGVEAFAGEFGAQRDDDVDGGLG